PAAQVFNIDFERAHAAPIEIAQFLADAGLVDHPADERAHAAVVLAEAERDAPGDVAVARAPGRLRLDLAADRAHGAAHQVARGQVPPLFGDDDRVAHRLLARDVDQVAGPVAAL